MATRCKPLLDSDWPAITRLKTPNRSLRLEHESPPPATAGGTDLAGIGEKADDLIIFDPEQCVNSLFN
jgi:hypothetical protein